MRMKKFVAIAMVAVLMLTASVGIAAELGMFDFLARKMGQEVLPEATNLVQSNVAYGETDHVTYNVKQAVYDGKSVSLMVEMRAKDEGTFLLGDGWMLDDPYGAIAYTTEREMLSDSRTIGEYAKENGYTRFLNVSVELGIRSDVAGVEEWQNNVLTVVYSLNAEGDVLNLPIEYFSFDMETGDTQRKADEIILTAASPLWQVSSNQTFVLPDYGIRIDGMSVTGTVLQSYWEVHYTITDAEKASGFYWFDLYTAQGETLPRGILGVGGSKILSDIDEQRAWHGGFGAMTAAPTQLMLQVRDVNGSASPVQLLFDLK